MYFTSKIQISLRTMIGGINRSVDQYFFCRTEFLSMTVKALPGVK